MVAIGFEQDAAELIARLVAETLVRSCLSGSLEPPSPATHPLNEAA